MRRSSTTEIKGDRKHWMTITLELQFSGSSNGAVEVEIDSFSFEFREEGEMDLEQIVALKGNGWMGEGKGVCEAQVF